MNVWDVQVYQPNALLRCLTSLGKVGTRVHVASVFLKCWVVVAMGTCDNTVLFMGMYRTSNKESFENFAFM